MQRCNLGCPLVPTCSCVCLPPHIPAPPPPPPPLTHLPRCCVGHELSVHTMTHPDETWMTLDYDELALEIGGQRDWLVHNCSVPER